MLPAAVGVPLLARIIVLVVLGYQRKPRTIYNAQDYAGLYGLRTIILRPGNNQLNQATNQQDRYYYILRCRRSQLVSACMCAAAVLTVLADRMDGWMDAWVQVDVVVRM